MGYLILVNGFDAKVNNHLNQAIEFAESINSKSVNTKHLAYTLLTDKGLINDATGIANELGKSLNELVNIIYNSIQVDVINKTEFTEGTFDIEYNSHIIINNDGSDIVLEDDIVALIQTLLDIHMATGMIVSEQNLFELALRAVDTRFGELLLNLGLISEDQIEDEEEPEQLQLATPIGINLTGMARDNLLDPVVDRDTEIDLVIEVLARRNKSNPCIVGEAGVGKTAIVHGLAQRVAKGKVPDILKNKNIIKVDISKFVAGSRFRGDFEEKFGMFLDKMVDMGDVILFFDDFHNLLDAGNGVESGLSAMKLLKPYMESGKLKIIGATTTKEFNKMISSDSEVYRRIQPIFINEPSIDQAINMVKANVPIYSKYHKMGVSDEAVLATVKLSDRYIADKKLPDKAITLLDDTLARVKLKSAKKKKVVLSAEDIKETISKLTGIDIRDLDKTEKEKLLSLDKNIKKRVVGQDEAINEIVRAIKRNKCGVVKTNRPIGSFLFIGPTGVGKTEVARVLAKELFGSEKNMVRLDMSEYMEKHTVSKLIGAPPGYVGHDDGGQLTSIIRNKPYSLILFDELEKAHPDVLNVLLQILEDGRLTDSKGNPVDFKNTIIIMTSNIGYQITKKAVSLGFSSDINRSENEKADIIKELENTFRPEFINRLDRVVVFNRLSRENIKDIVNIMLSDIKTNMKDLGIDLVIGDSLIEYIIEVGFSDKYGARNIRRKIQEVIEDYLADLILEDVIKAGMKVVLDYNGVCVKHTIYELTHA